MISTFSTLFFVQQSQPTAVGEQRSAGPSYPFQFKANMLPSYATTTRAPIFYKRNTPLAMTEPQSLLPHGVPAFKPLRIASSSNIQSMVKKPIDPSTQKGALHQYPAPNLGTSTSAFSYTKPAPPPRPGSITAAHQANAYKVPAFQSLPASVSRVSSGHIAQVGSADVKKLAASNAIDSSYSTIQRADVSFIFPCFYSKPFAALQRPVKANSLVIWFIPTDGESKR